VSHHRARDPKAPPLRVSGCIIEGRSGQMVTIEEWDVATECLHNPVDWVSVPAGVVCRCGRVIRASQ